MSSTIKQPQKNIVNAGLLLFFIDSVHFSNNSLKNLVKNSGENHFYNPSVNGLDLVKKK